MANKGFEKYIIVVWRQGSPYFLQYRNVVSWFFYNNAPKTYRRAEPAIKAAKMLSLKYKCDCVKVYGLTGEDTMIGVDEAHKFDKEAGRIVFDSSVKE